MPSKKLLKKLNEQIVNELYSSNAYLAIASYMDGLGLRELTKLYFEQSDEEHVHAMKILHFILEIGEDVKIGSVPEPQNGFESVEAAVAASLEQEKVVTQQIHDLMAVAQEEKDFPTIGMLRWFVAEQVEEISKMSDLLQLVKMAGKNLLAVEERLAAGYFPEEG